jgi:amidase
VPDLHDLTALEQAAAIRRGDLDPADLTAHYLARITAFDDSVGAFVRVFDAPPRPRHRATVRWTPWPACRRRSRI